MILVTGATGFLGAEVCSQLTASGGHIRAIKRPSSQIPAILKDNSLIQWMNAPLEDQAALAEAFIDVKQVYHCAAFISFDPPDKRKLFKVNIEGTANIADLCLKNHARLVHVSSVAALGDAKKGDLITENDFPDPGAATHAYGTSKLEGENKVWQAIEKGLDAVIVNPSVIIGPAAGFNGSGAIFKLVKDGLKFYTQGASGFVAVEDVAAAMLCLMNSGLTAERYIISAENLRYKELFKEIAVGFGVRAPFIKAAPWILGIAWRGAKLISAFTGKPPALTSDAAKSSFNLSYYDNQKIKSAIGIKFKPVKESIREITSFLKTL